MQRLFFRVDGADQDTGEETYLVLQASSREDAELIARRQGLLIAAVRAATAADWGAGPTVKPPARSVVETIVFEAPGGVIVPAIEPDAVAETKDDLPLSPPAQTSAPEALPVAPFAPAPSENLPAGENLPAAAAIESYELAPEPAAPAAPAPGAVRKSHRRKSGLLESADTQPWPADELMLPFIDAGTPASPMAEPSSSTVAASKASATDARAAAEEAQTTADQQFAAQASSPHALQESAPANNPEASAPAASASPALAMTPPAARPMAPALVRPDTRGTPGVYTVTIERSPAIPVTKLGADAASIAAPSSAAETPRQAAVLSPEAAAPRHTFGINQITLTSGDSADAALAARATFVSARSPTPGAAAGRPTIASIIPLAPAEAAAAPAAPSSTHAIASAPSASRNPTEPTAGFTSPTASSNSAVDAAVMPTPAASPEKPAPTFAPVDAADSPTNPPPLDRATLAASPTSTQENGHPAIVQPAPPAAAPVLAGDKPAATPTRRRHDRQLADQLPLSAAVSSWIAARPTADDAGATPVAPSVTAEAPTSDAAPIADRPPAAAAHAAERVTTASPISSSFSVPESRPVSGSTRAPSHPAESAAVASAPAQASQAITPVVETPPSTDNELNIASQENATASRRREPEMAMVAAAEESALGSVHRSHTEARISEGKTGTSPPPGRKLSPSPASAPARASAPSRGAAQPVVERHAPTAEHPTPAAPRPSLSGRAAIAPVRLPPSAPRSAGPSLPPRLVAAAPVVSPKRLQRLTPPVNRRIPPPIPSAMSLAPHPAPAAHASVPVHENVLDKPAASVLLVEDSSRALSRGAPPEPVPQIEASVAAPDVQHESAHAAVMDVMDRPNDPVLTLTDSAAAASSADVSTGSALEGLLGQEEDQAAVDTFPLPMGEAIAPPPKSAALPSLAISAPGASPPATPAAAAPVESARLLHVQPTPWLEAHVSDNVDDNGNSSAHLPFGIALAGAVAPSQTSPHANVMPVEFLPAPEAAASAPLASSAPAAGVAIAAIATPAVAQVSAPTVAKPPAVSWLVYLLLPLGLGLTLGGVALIVLAVLRVPPPSSVQIDRLDFRMQTLTQMMAGAIAFLTGVIAFLACKLMYVSRWVKMQSNR